MFILGAFCFGLVVGWVTYRTLRRTKTTGLSDIATVLGIVGGAAVTNLFPSGGDFFNSYCIGLAVGFFAYLVVSGFIDVKAAKNKSFKSVSRWLGGEPTNETDAEEPERELPVAGRNK